jgi:catechol 2,3-dioxygenase-like lactoylglutathione lyase family enzyme
MLADHQAAAIIAVKDLPKAKKFYEGTLGFRPVHE